MIVLIMLIGAMPLTAFAAFDQSAGSQYYQLISKRKWDLAPGIVENETVQNNSEGTRRQVVHTVEVDLNNSYTKVIPGYKGMIPTPGNYGTESTSVQALNAEKLGYGNVVAATNAMLSWYDNTYYKQHPELIGEPLGYSILNGYYYENSQGQWGSMSTSYAAVVINYDYHPITGEKRPDNIPKVMMRQITDPITGWEENALSVWSWLVKPDSTGTKGINQYTKEDHGSSVASRTFVGVKADGSLVLAVSDGEQAPYSTGFTKYEMADYMIKMGCIYAANCDGGGSTTFCSQRPGEDLKVNCSLSDGGERPTTNTFLVISTAPTDGVFARANITSDYDYYTPGSSVKFNVLGTDAVGTKVDVPDDVVWKIKEEGMGTIENGVFTSNGTEGIVTAQMIYNGNVVGEHTINIAIPDEISFEQPIVTIPFGKTAIIPVKATINNGLNEIGLSANDITFTTDNKALGSFDGLNFVAVEEANAPENLTSTVTAVLNMNTSSTATVKLQLGKASEVLWDFEGGQADIDEWMVINNRTNATHWDYDLDLSLADKTNGQVHDGNYSMRLETNGIHSKDSHSKQYAWIRLGVEGNPVVLENARSIGFWLYVPEDNIQCWVQGHYMYDTNGDGEPDTMATVSMMPSENVYYNIDESGWHYLEMDVSAYQKIALKYEKQFDKDPSDGMSGEKGDFFLAFVFHKATNNQLWQTNGSINGKYTYYLDNFTVDYSEAVDDRENPVFDKIYLDNKTPLVKRDVVTTNNNTLNLSAVVADATVRVDATGTEHQLYNTSGLDLNTAKVYIDGVEVPSTFEKDKMIANGIEVADGYHRAKFEICDKAGNKSVIIRVIKVESGSDASTLKLVPDDPTLDRVPFGSVYWMNLEANKIETIQSVSTVIDMNNVNHWELDHMELAEGFNADYTINEETNTATITITRTGDNDMSGSAVLAKIPARIIYFDTDILVPGYNAETYWTKYPFWPQDLKMDVDKGEITFVEGYTSTALNAFSNEEFHVDTEMYTHSDGIDKTYWAEHGTTHVHTPVAPSDKAPTCTESGYRNRTFCEGCNSVVDWGETIPATGHTYSVSGNRLVCSCGKQFLGSGLQNVNGTNYFTINGKLIGGWQNIDNEWYLFDSDTYAGVNGDKYSDAAVKFTFENGKVLHGTWVKVAGKLRYYYGPSYYRKTSPTNSDGERYVIDGKTYFFDTRGNMLTGIVKYFEPSLKEIFYYNCGEDGVASLLSGIYNGVYYENGKRSNALYKIVLFDGDYYFFGDSNILVKNQRLYLSEKFTAPVGLKEGYYTFDSEGKIVFKNGVIGDYLYINDEMVKAYQLVNYDGDYYFINDGHMIARNIRLYLSDRFVSGKTFADGTPIPAGYYEFDADGKMIIKNGVYGNFMYKNNKIVKAYQLVNYDGDYYFINDGHMIARNIRLYLSDRFVSGKTFADGTPIPAGYYEFDADGKMIIKDGVYGNFMYKNNKLVKAYQLVNYKGDYYFINNGHELARNTKLYLSDKFVEGKTYEDGTPLQVGYYEFDADGKMIGKNGVFGDNFYRNGIMLKCYQLVYFDGDYYFINDGHKVAKNQKVYMSAKYVAGKTFSDESMIPVGYYWFDENGKMIH